MILDSILQKQLEKQGFFHRLLKTILNHDKIFLNQAWWHVPTIRALRKLSVTESSPALLKGLD